MPFLRKATTSLLLLLILLPLIIKRDIITWKNCIKDCAVLVSYVHTLVDLYVRNYLLARLVPEPVTELHSILIPKVRNKSMLIVYIAQHLHEPTGEVDAGT